MALSDFRDKLATAEDYLLNHPLHSQAWAAAWEHVMHVISGRHRSEDEDDRAQWRAAAAVVRRVMAARWEQGMRERLSVPDKLSLKEKLGDAEGAGDGG